MLVKKPKSSFFRLLFKGGKIVLAAEAAACLVSYLGWRQLNTNQDLRYYMYKNHNWVLEGYYQVGERLSPSSGIRQLDLNQWASDGKQL